MMFWVTWCYCWLIVKWCLVSVVLASNTSCPNWHYRYSATGECECGFWLHCSSNGKQVEIKNDLCASSAQNGTDYYIGYCPLTRYVNNSNRKFSEMPSNVGQLEEVMCGPYNRRGLLCGECKEGYGPAVYSLDLKCTNCSSVWSRYGISLYLFLEFVPTTLIFICFIVFHLNITSGPLLGYVLFCQVTTALLHYHYRFVYDYMHHHMSSSLRVLLDLLVTISQFWGLQFFKTIIPPFCISEKLTGIHVHMLNLVPAIYPLVLVIVTCILMELHARKYRILEILWKPVKIILNKADITAVTSDAVFHAFASCIFLSNTSVLFAAMQLFNYIIIHNSTGHIIQKGVTYIDPTVEWNNHTSIPCVLTAVLICSIITIIPSVVLCIYPTRVYRHLSGCMSARKQLAITAFVEALHSCFKDGLNGTRDHRALAGSVVFLVMLVSSLNFVSSLVFVKNVSFIFTIMMWMILVCAVSYVKPCKSTVANISLIFHMTLFGILWCLTYLWIYDLSVETHTLELIVIVTFLSPHILVAVWAGYTFTKHTLTRCGYQFHGPAGCKVVLSDAANGLRLCLCRRYRGYQEMITQ